MVKTFNAKTFVDLKTLTIDKTQSQPERLKQFITDIKTHIDKTSYTRNFNRITG